MMTVQGGPKTTEYLEVLTSCIYDDRKSVLYMTSNSAIAVSPCCRVG